MAYKYRGLSSEKSLSFHPGTVKVLAAASAVSLRQIQKENESLRQRESLERLRKELDREWRLASFLTAEQQARVTTNKEIERKRSADKAFAPVQKKKIIAEMLAVGLDSAPGDEFPKHSAVLEPKLKSLEFEPSRNQTVIADEKVLSSPTKAENTTNQYRRVTKSQSMVALKNQNQADPIRKVTFMPVKEEVEAPIQPESYPTQGDAIGQDLKKELRSKRRERATKQSDSTTQTPKTPKIVAATRREADYLERECIELERKLSTVLSQVQRLQTAISTKHTANVSGKSKAKTEHKDKPRRCEGVPKQMYSEEARLLVEEERTLRETVLLLQEKVRAEADRLRLFEGLQEKVAAVERDNEYWRRWLAAKQE